MTTSNTLTKYVFNNIIGFILYVLYRPKQRFEKSTETLFLKFYKGRLINEKATESALIMTALLDAGGARHFRKLVIQHCVTGFVVC